MTRSVPSPPDGSMVPLRMAASISSRAVSNTAAKVSWSIRDASVSVALEQAAVELEREGGRAVAGLDDPRDHALLDGSDDIVGEQLLHVVVEAGLRHLELGGQLLDGPRRVLALDHHLQDLEAGRVADGAQCLGGLKIRLTGSGTKPGWSSMSSAGDMVLVLRSSIIQHMIER